MSLFDNSGNGMYMPVAPAGGNGGYGCGGWGDGSFWIIVLFIFAIMGNGWGNGFGGNGGMMPYMMSNNTNNDVQRGFDQQAVVGGISGLNNNLYAAQSAIDARLDSLAMAQQNCCCENRAATADVKYTVANEAAATRANTDAKVQMVMDKLCQLELDGVKQNYENRIAGMQQNYENHIAGMQNQLDDLRLKVNDAKFDASQNAQTATIQAGQRSLANEVEQYVLPTARPAYIVQNPNCCQNNYGWSNCGCATA